MIGLLLQLLWLGLLGLKVFALIDCARRPTAVFALHGKLTKPAWLAILGVAAITGYWFGPLGLFGLAGTVAAIVYLVDVKPAVTGKSF